MLDDGELKGIAKDIIDSLEIFLPFLRESIDYVNIGNSIAVARASQEIINKKFQFSRTPIIGLETLSPLTPLPNVLLTGGIFGAALGFEGEILSGIRSAILGQEVASHGR